MDSGIGQADLPVTTAVPGPVKTWSLFAMNKSSVRIKGGPTVIHSRRPESTEEHQEAHPPTGPEGEPGRRDSLTLQAL